MPPTRLRIGLDARAADPTPSGLSTYARHLVSALIDLDTPHSFVVYRRPDAGPPFADGRVEERLLNPDASTPTLARQLDTSDLDLFHALHHFLPFSLSAPRIVVTLHDLIWVEQPHLIRTGGLAPITRAVSHWYARGAIGYALRRADHVIAISRYTRGRAIARYGVPEARVSVVHHGVDHGRFASPDHGSAGAGGAEGAGRAGTAGRTAGAEGAGGAGGAGGAEGRYFLCVGNTKPYKNVPVAIDAFAICARQFPDVRLVIAGRGDSLAALNAQVMRLGLQDRVEFTGSVSDRELIALMRGAQALVFPSLVEGFGLPVLEAMAAGCAVIGSEGTAVAEVAGSAALLCDPRQPSAFATAMARVLTTTGERERLVRAGLDRAQAFQWQRCAEQTVAVYESLLHRPR